MVVFSGTLGSVYLVLVSLLQLDDGLGDVWVYGAGLAEPTKPSSPPTRMSGWPQGGGLT